MSSSILVIEDEDVTQRMIAMNLERAGHRVRCVSNVRDAQMSLVEKLPDLVLLDWVLPNGTGISLLRRMRADPRAREVPVIMLTSRQEEGDKVIGLESGADDYLTKPFSVRELLARINAHLRRTAPETLDEAVRVAGLCIDPLRKRVTSGPIRLGVSDLEFRMLHLFATHPGRVYSREQLLDRLWGDQVYVQDRTVDAHIRALRQALRPSGHDRLIETVRGVGYGFRAASQDMGRPEATPSELRQIGLFDWEGPATAPMPQ